MMIDVSEHTRNGRPVSSYTRAGDPAIREQLAQQRAQTRAAINGESLPLIDRYQRILENRERRRRIWRTWVALPVRDKFLTLWTKFRGK